MPAAKGKVEVKLMLTDTLKAELDTEAQTRGLDRSTLICQRLDASYLADETAALRLRLDELVRGQVMVQEHLVRLDRDMAALVAGVQDVLEASRQSTPAAKVYPTPATPQETWPELYEPLPATVEVPPVAAPQKRWGLWSR